MHPSRPAGRYNSVNGEYQAIAKELEKANAEFKEFERKDIKYRWGGVGCWWDGCSSNVGWRVAG